MPSSTHRTLGDLLNELEAAIRAGDTYRIEQLREAILQRFAEDAAERAALERQVRYLTTSRAPLESLSLSIDDPVRGPDSKVYEQTRAITRGGEPDTTPAPDAGLRYPVWFGTNRRPLPGGDGFSGERNDRITRGRVEVLVPKAHRFGEIGTPFWRRLLRFDLRSDRLRVERIETLDRDEFFAQIRQTMASAANDEHQGPQALFFLHGYNVTFEDAAIRAAQLGCDLSVPGATAFFSWPSRGNAIAYPADEASIEASERAITEFLVDFVAECGAAKVHVIAHSMGNRGLLRALQRIAANAETRGKFKLGQIFLAAPDLDSDLFLDLAELYPEHSERTTLYTSGRDLPVHLSSKLHDAPRAGYFEPYTVAPGIDTIAVPNFNVDLLGHSYFAQAAAMLHDMFDLLRHGEPPRLRQRIVRLQAEGKSLWRVRQ